VLAADRARIHPSKEGVPIDSRAGEFDDVNILYEPVNSSAKVVPDLFVSFGTGKTGHGPSRPTSPSQTNPQREQGPTQTNPQRKQGANAPKVTLLV
jgi:hypothetical protein